MLKDDAYFLISITSRRINFFFSDYFTATQEKSWTNYEKLRPVSSFNKAYIEISFFLENQDKFMTDLNKQITDNSHHDGSCNQFTLNFLCLEISRIFVKNLQKYLKGGSFFQINLIKEQKEGAESS